MIETKPVFVRTKNVRNFEVMMDDLARAEGEGRFGMVFGQAGRGKTRTAQWYAANNGCAYLRMAGVWRTSELDFLQALCRELGVLTPSHRKGPCYVQAIDKLVAASRPVFFDEIERLPASYLDLCRDIADMSGAAFIMIGEEELHTCMSRNRRVWSRTFQHIEFEPLAPSDIIIYAAESTGLKLEVPVAAVFHRASGGDFRIVRRDLLSLVQMLNAQGKTEVTEALAKIAVKAGLTGK